jgi:short-subunit dehydrogenase involved in D-alanine esterification of teichoic acids
MFQPGLFKGKRILVTGGGTGLGREMVDKYLELGADLYICGRRREVLEQTAKELTQMRGGSVRQMLSWGDAEWEQARALIKAQNEKDKAQRSV